MAAPKPQTTAVPPAPAARPSAPPPAVTPSTRASTRRSVTPQTVATSASSAASGPPAAAAPAPHHPPPAADDDDDTLTGTDIAPRLGPPTPSTRPLRPAPPTHPSGAARGGDGGDASITTTPEPRPRMDRMALRPLSGNAGAAAVAVDARRGGASKAPGPATGGRPRPLRRLAAGPSGSLRSPPERIASSRDRIGRIESRLADMGLAPPPPQRRPPPQSPGGTAPAPPASSSSPPDGSDPATLFLHALRSMDSVVGRTPDSVQRSRKGRALDALLTVFESVMDEASHRAEEAEYWNDRETEAARRLRGAVEECRGLRRRLGAVEAERDADESRSASLRDASTWTDAEVCDGGEVPVVRMEQLQTVRDENERLRAALRDMGRKRDGPNDVSSSFSGTHAATALSAQHEQLHRDLRHRVSELEAENDALRQSLRQMDADRERLEFQLDEASAQKGQTFSQHGEPSRRGGRCASVSSEGTGGMSTGAGPSREDELHRALSAKDREIIHLRETLRHVQTESEQIRQVASARADELGRAHGDLSALTREGRAVTAESARIGAELRAVRARLEEEVRRADAAEHKVRASDLERGDLLRNYRAACEERESLRRAVEELTGERSRLGHELALYQEESRRLAGQLKEWEREVARRSADASNFERRLDGVSRDGLAARRRLEAAEAENRRLKEDIMACRKSAGMASAHTVELQRTAAQAQHDAEALRGAVSGLEAERDAMRAVLAEERHRTEGLEALLSSARARDAAAADQTRKLARENAQLKTRLNEARARGEPPCPPSSPRIAAQVAGSPQVDDSQHGVGISVMAVSTNAGQEGSEALPIAAQVEKEANIDGRNVEDESSPNLADYLEGGD